MTRASSSGFTLPELLVALLIFSMVAGGCVYALRLGIEARDQLDEVDKRLAEMATARLLIREDMLQLVDRPVRDEFGLSAGPAFFGGLELEMKRPVKGEKPLLAFVRRGWSNPESQAPRSTLQYVEYLVRDGALIRRVRSYLDDARGQPRHERVLIADAGETAVSFFAGEARGELQWIENWPLGAGGGFPRAITITMESPRYGQLVQRYWIGAIAEFGAEES